MLLEALEFPINNSYLGQATLERKLEFPGSMKYIYILFLIKNDLVKSGCSVLVLKINLICLLLENVHFGYRRHCCVWPASYIYYALVSEHFVLL